MDLLLSLKTLLVLPKDPDEVLQVPEVPLLIPKRELPPKIVAGPVDRGLSPTPTHWQPLAKRPRRPGPQLSIASSLSLGSAGSSAASPGPGLGAGVGGDLSRDRDAALPLPLPPWSCTDLAKTGRLLALPPTPVDFDDEAEMRRVFALAYDVFRYKHVLQQALDDCGFFKQYPQHAGDTARAWLLLFDLHKRQFRPREAMDLHLPPQPPAIGPPQPPEEPSRQALLSAGLADMDDDLWEIRVHLAAALARLRVKRRALRLCQLLPPHLQDGRTINHEDALVTGWINTFRSTREHVCAAMERQGLRHVDDGPAGRERTLDAARDGAASVSLEDFRFDPVLPNVIVCHPEQRDDLAQAAVVRKCYLVMQDRAFCFGPAMMCKLLSDYDLSGCVAQTHIHSPRSTAYLAAILAANMKIDSLLAFGAGSRKQQYKAYFRKLGVTNAEVYEERFLDIHETSLMDNVVAVLATPPNSYSAVTDPVDLVCSRGGDLGMLRQLTEPSGPGGGPGAGGSGGLLQEQAATLRLAMAKPQVQFVVYETHSVYPSENQRLVRRLVREVNELARERHAEDQRRAAWLASLAAASNQGVPGEKRAKQKEAKQQQQREQQQAEKEKEAAEKDKEAEGEGKDRKKKKGKKDKDKDAPKTAKMEVALAALVKLKADAVKEDAVKEDAVKEDAVKEDAVKEAPVEALMGVEEPVGDGAAEEGGPSMEVGVAGEGDGPPTAPSEAVADPAAPPVDPAPEAATTGKTEDKAEAAPEPPQVAQVAAEVEARTQQQQQPAEPPAPAPAPEPAELQTPAPPEVEVPACDLFEIGILPDMCPLSDGCLSTQGMQAEGCFLALIRRKEIVRMDANYMIKMAEARGLFGSAPGARKPTAAERARKKREREEEEARARGGGSRRGKGGPVDVERLSAQTRSSRARQHRIPLNPRRASNMSWESDDSHEGPDVDLLDDGCPRYVQHMQAVESLPGRILESRRRDARRWWSEATRHMAGLPPGLVRDSLAHYRYQSRLRLTRSAAEHAPSATICYQSMHRHPFPTRVCLLEL